MFVVRERRNVKGVSIAALFGAALLVVGVTAFEGRADVGVSGDSAAVDAGASWAGAVALDRDSYAAYHDRQELVLTDLALGDGSLLTLDLSRFELFTADARVVRGTASGDVAMERPPVALFRGRVRGADDSSAFLSLSPFGVYGLIRQFGEVLVISSGPATEAWNTQVYNLTTLPPGLIVWREFACGTDELPEFPPGDGGGATTLRPTPCRIAEIALDTDLEFTRDLFGGDATASAAYATTLLGAISEIYERDVVTNLVVSYLRVWEADDPWTETDAYALLEEFQNYWGAHMGDVRRNTAHLLLGRSPTGAAGLAYMHGLCGPGAGYGLSGSLNGFFPYPLVDHDSQNWDVYVVAHELGHNFGAPHTHSTSPPIDGCGLGDCTDAYGGTIMSYCQACPGGMANIVLAFHDRIIAENILPYLDSDEYCDLDVDPMVITEQPEGASVCPGEGLSLHVSATTVHGLPRYQWRKDGIELVDGDGISGATTATLTLDPVGLLGGGDYDVIVTDDCGPLASDEASVLVYCMPTQVDQWGGYYDIAQSLATRDDVLLVGGASEYGTWAEAVDVYRRIGTEWVFEQQLVAADYASMDRFGSATSVDGDVAVIGAFGNDDLGDYSGSAYVFRRDGSGWVQEQKLLADDGASADYFGRGAVSVLGDVIVVGARGDDDLGDGSGAAYVFRFDGSTWVQEQKLLADDGGPGDFFGDAVAVCGDTVLIGAWGVNDLGGNCGAAYVFRFDGSTWVQQSKLFASDAAEGDGFGDVVAVDGDVAVIGADGAGYVGAAYVFRYDGGSWVEEQKLVTGDLSYAAYFGNSVAVLGDAALIGDPGDSELATDAGAAYLFRFDGSAWRQQVKLFASDAEWRTDFGGTAALSDRYAFVGAGGSDSVYLFDLAAGAPVISAPPSDQSAVVGDSVSFSVVAEGECTLSYAWRRDGAILSDDDRISGATTATLTIDPVQTSDAGGYDVVVANDCGSVVSATAALSVAFTDCPGDLDGDRDVDLADLAQLLSNYRQTSGMTYADGDMDGDGDVDLSDLAALLAYYGVVCP